MINLTSIPPIPEEPDIDSNSFLRLMNFCFARRRS